MEFASRMRTTGRSYGALRWGGYWLDGALACERGLLWSDASLVDLAGAADVAAATAQGL